MLTQQVGARGHRGKARHSNAIRAADRAEGPSLVTIGPGRRARTGLASQALEVVMIEQLQDMPAGVNGIRISGRVTADDFAQFKPTLDRMLDTEEIRFVEIIGPDYEGFGPGGLLADVKQGFSNLKHIRAFKRTAVVSDKEWIAHTIHALGWMISGEVALFGMDELEDAKRWAAG
jgi:hypothetical protein